ncbi:hypothetical protein DAPPUDRAFT_246066 [Daphnia pulex]|uniref:Ionotropic glutamate receptor C-terminal domain-containing protein n=1 Tax=Daphnia pulex TaxID=6669 RepID=E9GPK5_DAPPU|nr:hypothetical protein DAPPUDRAFT_246066 [Daphnia pulex]|eukprot:EFX78662.1 hypothetical protein DAPPUDRAFT_246066 [Daphnia pulex]
MAHTSVSSGFSSTPNPLNGQHLHVIWQCDLLAQDVLPTFQRNKIVDLTTYWYYGDLVFLIPVPDETANINSVVKPFQWKRYLEYRSVFIMDLRPNNIPLPEKLTNDDQIRAKKWQTGKQYLYVFGNLLSQGGFCPLKWLPFRLVAGAWTLAAFFFVQSYTSTLFTYVVTPINPPLINSVDDIVDSGDINLLAKAFVMDEIRKDFKKKGKCNFQLAKESFISTMASFALSKNSPYTQRISQGELR